MNLSDRWARPANQQAPVTFVLIAISVISAFAIGFQPDMNRVRAGWLWISFDNSLRQVFRGEVWRLISPIFLHMSLLHLVFNMLNLREFGLLVEIRKGSGRYLLYILLIALVSNFAQFKFQGPFFGGMSGVVYGLFGYAWIKGKLDPESGFLLPPQTITILLVWFFLCVMGWLGSVANWAHGGGLVAGMAIAYLETQLEQIRRRK